MESTDLPFLEVEPELPTVREAVTVMGNSDGAGVATQISGQVLGVGPELVEVDAKFVQGNSGSPILNGAGRVIGVASFATRDEDVNNWVKNGTRFNTVRRFGYRLNHVQWKEMTWQDLGKRVYVLNDIDRLCFDLFMLKYTRHYRNANGGVAVPAEELIKSYQFNRNYANALNNLSRELNQSAQDYWKNQIDPAQLAQFRRSDPRRQPRMGLTHEAEARRRRDVAHVDRLEHRNMLISLEHILFRDPDHFMSLNTMQALGKDVRSVLVHDHWGSDFLKERADYLYGLFVSVANGEILMRLQQ